jgi:hypothetical protein
MSDALIRTFQVSPPYYGPLQLVLPIHATLVRVNPDGNFLVRCNAICGDDEYDDLEVTWNIEVLEKELV